MANVPNSGGGVSWNNPGMQVKSPYGSAPQESGTKPLSVGSTIQPGGLPQQGGGNMQPAGNFPPTAGTSLQMPRFNPQQFHQQSVDRLQGRPDRVPTGNFSMRQNPQTFYRQQYRNMQNANPPGQPPKPYDDGNIGLPPQPTPTTSYVKPNFGGF